MAKPVLRRAVLEDVPDIQALTIRAYTKWLDVTPRPPRPITADYDQAFLDHRFDLLVDQGQIIGLVETTPQGDELMIVNIAVSPDNQGKGHGVRLMLHAEKIARDAGLRGTRLYTNKLMNSNIAMYQRLGYVIEKETHHDLGTIAVHMIHPFLPVGPVVENGHAALPAFQQHEGRCVTLAPLSASHSLQLWDAAQSGDASWTYLRYGPFGSDGDLKNHLQKVAGVADQPYFAVTPATSGMAEGWLSFCDISPENSSIEIGSIWYSPRLQRTRAATEAIYLLLDYAFSLGYHRVAWRCNPLNEASMRAAQRFGFTLEGIWREARIVKGRRCDLAWFSMLEQEWPAQRAKFETWLEDSNFDASGMALRPMADTKRRR
jgi:RimJ/RimL family protein N-acetyltransferase/ribosomal protein S18 acetylase RimI-like enzyme